MLKSNTGSVKFMNEKLKEQLKKDQALITSLKLNHISHILCSSDKGNLALLLRKNKNSYELTLDNIPLSPEECTFVFGNIQHLI